MQTKRFMASPNPQRCALGHIQDSYQTTLTHAVRSTLKYGSSYGRDMMNHRNFNQERAGKLCGFTSWLLAQTSSRSSYVTICKKKLLSMSIERPHLDQCCRLRSMCRDKKRICVHNYIYCIY